MDVSKDTILQAWKSEEYRSSLPADVQREIPAKPTSADGRELSDEELEGAAGGISPTIPLGIAAGAAFATGLGVGVAAEEGAD